MALKILAPKKVEKYLSSSVALWFDIWLGKLQLCALPGCKVRNYFVFWAGRAALRSRKGRNAASEHLI